MGERDAETVAAVVLGRIESARVRTTTKSSICSCVISAISPVSLYTVYGRRSGRHERSRPAMRERV